MKVQDLKKLLEGVDGNMDVLIPTSTEFDGVFLTPCNEESGVSEMGVADSIEELNEPIDEVMEELVGKKANQFLLVPCGFFEEKSHTHELN